MKSRNFRSLLIASLLILITATALGSFEPSAQAAPDSERMSRPAAQALIAKAEQQGSMRVIVRLNTESRPEGGLGASSAARQQQRIKRLQAQVLDRLPPEAVGSAFNFDRLPFLVVEVTPAGLAELLASPEVLSYQEDVAVPPLLSDSVPLIGADDAWALGYVGSGWAVAVLDTGVDTDHSAFSGKILTEACFSGGGSTGGEGATLCPNGQIEQIGTGAGENCATSISGCDHGTHVAGIAVGAGSPAGVAKGGSLIPVQIFSEFTGASCTDFGMSSPCVLTYTSDQMRALEWLYGVSGSYQIASANMSIGGTSSNTNYCDTDGRKIAIDNLVSVDIATVIAAGNSGDTDGISSPACISSSISVGASTDSDSVAAFSNVAEIMDLFAPGSGINAAVPGGYSTKSGTSMAAPHVAGAWAILKSKSPAAGVEELLTQLVDSGVSITDSRTGGSVTKPRIQVEAALGPEPTPVDLAPYFDAVELASGFSQPLYVTHAGDGSGRLFVLERSGLIKIIKDGSVLADPFLDLSSKVTTSGSEQGLLGLAFHPAYGTNGEFFTHYTDSAGAITVSRWSVSGDPDQADATSEQVLLSISKSNTNHNGGMLAFGPDGYLYIATGDGGGGGDPDENAQDVTSLLGKILRIDVDSGSPYAIPSNNPLAGSSDPDVRKEIWAYGLRNPWRFSFDRGTGDLFIADVGQGSREEVNYQASTSGGGENYGWDDMEGSICYEPSSGCETSSRVLPVAEYSHSDPDVCSVTGGYVYRGSEHAVMDGVYLYADFCSGDIWSLEYFDSGGWVGNSVVDTDFVISSFGEDEAGNLYFLDYAGGKLYKVHIQQFADVPHDHWAVDYIESLYEAGYVAGCAVSPRYYCPENILDRAEASVFVERGIHDLSYFPANPSFQRFDDVPLSSWAAKWTEALYQDGYTAGCATDPLAYCPWQENTRTEASVFFLHMVHGADWTPPSPSGIFADVPVDWWGAKWAEAAYNEGLIPACSTEPLEFCPNNPLDRARAAYMMVQAKGGLPLE